MTAGPVPRTTRTPAHATASSIWSCRGCDRLATCRPITSVPLHNSCHRGLCISATKYGRVPAPAHRAGCAPSACCPILL